MAQDNCEAFAFAQNEAEHHSRSHRTCVSLVQRPRWTLREHEQFPPKAAPFAKLARRDSQRNFPSNCSFDKWNTEGDIDESLVSQSIRDWYDGTDDEEDKESEKSLIVSGTKIS